MPAGPSNAKQTSNVAAGATSSVYRPSRSQIPIAGLPGHPRLRLRSPLRPPCRIRFKPDLGWAGEASRAHLAWFPCSRRILALLSPRSKALRHPIHPLECGCKAVTFRQYSPAVFPGKDFLPARDLLPKTWGCFCPARLAISAVPRGIVLR